MGTIIRIICRAALVVLLLLPVFAFAQTQQGGPDLLHTLGIGSRSIAMGGAFTAIADDASASFWNPARLGELPYFQAMVQYRNVLRISQTEGEAADYWDPANTENNGVTVLPFKLTFLGIAKPMGDYEPAIGASMGTWGLSYTLGGYFDYRTRFANTFENYLQLQQENRLVENHYLTLGWGKNVLIAYTPRTREPKTSTVAPIVAAMPTAVTTPALVANPNTEFVNTTPERKAYFETMAVVPDGDTAVEVQPSRPAGPVRHSADLRPAPPVLKPAIAKVEIASANMEMAGTPVAQSVAPAAPVEQKTRLYKIGIGLAGFQLTQNQTKRYANVVINTDNDVLESGDIFAPLSTSGNGYGFLTGITAEMWGHRTQNGNEMLPPGGRWRIGATYRSSAKVSGLVVKMPDEDFDLGDQFGREIPARITTGLAYEYTEPEESVARSSKIRAPRQITLSGEVQHFTSANENEIALDRRRAVTNLHFGAEYIPTRQWLPIPFLRRLTEDGSKLAYVEPIRIGVRTNKAGNVYDLFEDDVVVSAGFAIYYSPISGGARGMYDFSFESAVEYLLEAEKPIWTISSSYRF